MSAALGCPILVSTEKEAVMFDDLKTDELAVAEFSCDRDGEVRAWRYDEFLRLGFVAGAAWLLVEAEADLALARRLIGLGCPHGTAAAILH
jgi:hypothetical protein